VQNAATGERREFANLESLLVFWRTLRLSPEPTVPGSDSETTF
jgi:hypothetical protein